MIPLYLSRPGLWMPETKLTNEDVLERVRDRYQGPAAQWPLVENGVNLIFKACQSAERFKEQDPTVRIGTMAVRASRDCLAMCNQAPEELDAVIYGGIGRDYLEPATAMEVAGKLGVEQARILDVVGACTGQLLAITTACAWFHMYDTLHTALICGAELARDHVVYDIQSYEEVPYLGAGVTIGDGASAWLLSRRPLPGGCLRIVAAETLALPQHWQLSQTPLQGRFSAQSSELLRVGGEVIQPFHKLWQQLGWSLDSIEQFLVHQPGQALHQKLLGDVGIAAERALSVHAIYGNTGSVAVATAAHEYLKRETPPSGTRLALLGIGAGLNACVIAGEWVG